MRSSSASSAAVRTSGVAGGMFVGGRFASAGCIAVGGSAAAGCSWGHCWRARRLSANIGWWEGEDDAVVRKGCGCIVRLAVEGEEGGDWGVLGKIVYVLAM